MSERQDVAASVRSGGAFAALLARLRTDGDDAQAYEALRRRLIQYFRLHLPAEAEELADISLDRLARKIHEGTEVASVPSYTLGIARMVLHEAHARGARRHLAELDPTLVPDAGASDDAIAAEATLAALAECLDAAGTPSRRLILAYYGFDGAARIAARRTLAEECGISLNALRNRALRLRDALEVCVRRRTNRSEDA